MGGNSLSLLHSRLLRESRAIRPGEGSSANQRLPRRLGSAPPGFLASPLRVGPPEREGYHFSPQPAKLS